MGHPLDGCVGKVNRGTTHLQTLQADVTAWMAHVIEAKPYNITFEPDPESTDYIFRLNVFEEAPTVRWGILVGDIVHSARSVLDHLVEQLTILNLGVRRSGTGFPVFTSPADFHRRKPSGVPEKGSGLRMLRGVHPEDCALIETMQPYHRPDWENHPLWMLHKLWNIDKHRVVPVVGLAVNQANITFSDLIIEGVVDTAKITDRLAFEDGAELARLPLAADQKPEANVELEPSLEVALREGMPGAGRPLITLLRNELVAVAWIIETFRDRFP